MELSSKIMSQKTADNNSQRIMPFQDVAFTIEERVEDLIHRMTLEEKVAQMAGVWETKSEVLLDEAGNLDIDKAGENFSHGNGLGQVGRPSDSGKGKNPRETAELTNAIQRFFIENSRLGIPVIFHEECLHGMAAPEATHYPQPIGLAATFNPSLIQKIFRAVGTEAASRGAHQALCPVLDVARDARWGRVEETFGEDPYLVGQMGLAVVRGLQGEGSFQNKDQVLATLKHFAAHGQPEAGCNCAPVNVSERVLREVFLPPFQVAIQQGHAGSVMASYNEIDSVPSHANTWLLDEVLRGEWGFDGFIVSDYYGITELNERVGFFGQFLSEDKSGAARLAVDAGVSIELPEPDCYPHLIELVRQGEIDESQLDALVKPMLRAKFELGLFDQPYVDPDEAEAVSLDPVHRQLAKEAAEQTITLLKNERDAAPLDLNEIQTLAVIGPNAHRELLGGYSDHPREFVTVLDGIKARAGDAVNVLYHEGCQITVGGSWWDDEVVLSDPESDRKMISEAVQVAEKADAIVLALGGNEQTSREAFDVNHKGDRTNLQMVGLQEELVDAMLSTGKPVIVLLFNGRPLAIQSLKEKVPVIFECWYLGQETGHAVAGVLFGDVNPGGKLPISIPRSVGHIPCYYNYKPSARRSYLFDETSALYDFGFGLSYTSFEFTGLQLDKTGMNAGDTAILSVDVTNTGDRAGDEVVQIYIRDLVSSVTRPVKELKGFQRISLKPGEKKQVQFEIGGEQLKFFTIRKVWEVEPGAFELMVGSSSRDEDLQRIRLTVNAIE